MNQASVRPPRIPIFTLLGLGGLRLEGCRVSREHGVAPPSNNEHIVGLPGIDLNRADEQLRRAAFRRTRRTTGA
jgi:hypothetical protein